MQRVQPEIKKIQEKYKDDKQKQNEELLKFYQENKSTRSPAACRSSSRCRSVRAVPGAAVDPGPRPDDAATFNELFRDLCGSASDRGGLHATRRACTSSG